MMARENTLRLMILLLLMFACSFPGSDGSPTSAVVGNTPVVAVEANVTPAQNALVPSEHHIGVRLVDGAGEFYNRLTGQKFIPRGMNYIRLGSQLSEDGTPTFGHSLFDPGKYDSARADAALSQMHSDGYNVVRVFLSPDTMGTKTGGLSPGYMQNIADFLLLARKSQMYVMFTQDWLPGGKYGAILSADCCDTFAVMNAFLLPPAGVECE